MAELPDVLDINELSNIIGKDPKWIRARKNEIEHHAFGNTLLFTKTGVLEFFERNKVSPRPDPYSRAATGPAPCTTSASAQALASALELKRTKQPVGKP